jgi:hypothetical protein
MMKIILQPCMFDVQGMLPAGGEANGSIRFSEFLCVDVPLHQLLTIVYH